MVNSAIGGSTNAPIHINAHRAPYRRRARRSTTGRSIGHDDPAAGQLQPAGDYLGEEYHRAGGVPAVVRELMAHKRIHEDALTVNGTTMGENCREAAEAATAT